MIRILQIVYRKQLPRSTWGEDRLESRPKRRLERVREAIQRGHCSRRTEESYVHWIKRYILFHNKRHPKDMGRAE